MSSVEATGEGRVQSADAPAATAVHDVHRLRDEMEALLKEHEALSDRCKELHERLKAFHEKTRAEVERRGPAA